MRMAELEKTIKNIKQEIEELQKRPPIHVDNIEYKFDQLKVETLDGVLNIGLNPNDLNSIEDFQVDNNNQLKNSSLSPLKKMETTMRLENNLFQYLDENLDPIVRHWEEQSGRKVNEDIIAFMKEDIKKQLPDRINDYLKKIKREERSGEALQAALDQIEEQMKQDIGNAVIAFLNQLPGHKS